MTFTILQPEGWQTPKKILVILAHPDDPEFFIGGSIFRWIKAGHQVDYCLLTRGDKGSDDIELSAEQIMETRMQEQRKAADVLGVEQVIFLKELDGFLNFNESIQKQVVRVIRQVKPAIVVSCDPQNYCLRGLYINHSDHREAGEITLRSVFPASGNVHYFPELFRDEGLSPHSPEEVWLAFPVEANVTLDVTEHWLIRMDAIKQHASQIGDPLDMEAKQLMRRTLDSTLESPRFEDQYKRLYKR